MKLPLIPTILLLSFLLQVVFCRQVFANTQDCQQVDHPKIVRVGSGNFLAPFHYLVKGKPAGLDIEIVKLILKDAGFCFKYVHTPSSARSMLEIEQGRIDMLFSASYTEKRARFSNFSIPYRHETIALFWQPKQGNNNENTPNLNAMLAHGLTGVVNLGGYYGAEVETLLQNKEVKLHQVNSINRRMKMLLTHRVDFVIEDEISGKYYLKKNHINSVLIHPYKIHQNEVGLMFSKKTFTLKELSLINKAIVNNKNKIQQIVSRYTN